MHSIEWPGTPLPSVVPVSFLGDGHTQNAVHVPEQSPRESRPPSSSLPHEARPASKAKRRVGLFIGAERPSARLFTELNPDSGEAMTVSVPALQATGPVVSAVHDHVVRAARRRDRLDVREPARRRVDHRGDQRS